jgi:hypothetical protein
MERWVRALARVDASQRARVGRRRRTGGRRCHRTRRCRLQLFVVVVSAGGALVRHTRLACPPATSPPPAHSWPGLPVAVLWPAARLFANVVCLPPPPPPRMSVRRRVFFFLRRFRLRSATPRYASRTATALGLSGPPAEYPAVRTLRLPLLLHTCSNSGVRACAAHVLTSHVLCARVWVLTDAGWAASSLYVCVCVCVCVSVCLYVWIVQVEAPFIPEHSRLFTRLSRAEWTACTRTTRSSPRGAPPTLAR